jgi:hypothetical protein
MIPKITVVAALVLFGFLGLAEAQGEGGVHSSAGSTVAGWNFFHITHCLTFADIFYFYPLESIGVTYFFTDSFSFSSRYSQLARLETWLRFSLPTPRSILHIHFQVERTE